MLIHVSHITREALNGDPILVDGEQGIVHLRPTDDVKIAFQDKLAMLTKEQQKYAKFVIYQQNIRWY